MHRTTWKLQCLQNNQISWETKLKGKEVRSWEAMEEATFLTVGCQKSSIHLFINYLDCINM